MLTLVARVQFFRLPLSVARCVTIPVLQINLFLWRCLGAHATLEAPDGGAMKERTIHYVFKLIADDGVQIVEADIPESVPIEEITEKISTIISETQRKRLLDWNPPDSEMN